VRVAIFDDRMEIRSDGRLPAGLTVADLSVDHPSRLRNPIIADVLYRRGLVERWGRGTQRIIELCIEAGHPSPEFVEQAGAIGVRFLPSGYVAPHRVTHALSSRQREILSILSDAKAIPFHVLRERMKRPPADRTIRDDLSFLKKAGLVESRGFGRGSVWLLKQNKAE
jgi:ATP-dependent DNA helicase RecG